MKNLIKILILLGVVVFLYSFANKRNANRKLERISVEFTDGDNLFISEAMVNKLLIQKKGSLANLTKDSLVLSVLESVLTNHEMVADAEVYISVDGILGTKVEQRKPIGRVLEKGGDVYRDGYYIDMQGELMPLSKQHSARVPLLRGLAGNHEECVSLLKKIESDDFLKKHVVYLQRSPEGDYVLGLRNLDFEVFFGKMEGIERKISNFKAFYKKAMEKGKLDDYKRINLSFKNQVVGTKKIIQ